MTLKSFTFPNTEGNHFSLWVFHESKKEKESDFFVSMSDKTIFLPFLWESSLAFLIGTGEKKYFSELNSLLN